MRVGIIGASSQVGASVAYLLKNQLDIEVICFLRSSYGRVYFDLLEIPLEIVDMSDRQKLTEKFRNLDVIVDFTYPSGQMFSIKQSIRANLTNIFSCMPTKSSFIYMSSISAYGMPLGEKYIRDYKIPRTSYAHIKRYAEKTVEQLGRKYKVAAFNLRIGQVHGFLQSVNTSFRRKLSENQKVYVDGSPNDLTNTVFVSSIAEAIIGCASHLNKEGTYTLVSLPQWTLKQLYEFYIRYYNLTTEIFFIPSNPKKGNRNILKLVFAYFKPYRPLIETYFLMRLPTLATWMKGRFRENHVLDSQSKPKIEDIDFNLLGKPSNNIIKTNCEIDHIWTTESRFEMDYNSKIKAYQK